MKTIRKLFEERISALVRNLSLQRKISFILISNVAVLLLLFLLGFHVLSGAYNELLYRSIAGNLSFSSYTLSTSLKDVERLSTILISTPAIQDSLVSIHGTDSAVIWSNANKRINSSLMSYYDTYKKNGISYIMLFNDKFSNTTNWAAYQKTTPEFVELALKNAETADGAVRWTLSPGNNSGIFLGRNIRKIEDMDFSTIGRLLIYVDINRLITEINRAFQTYETSSYILADGDSPIYTSEGLSGEMIRTVLETADKNYQTIRVGSHIYFAVNSMIPEYNWRYVNLIPLDNITRSLSQSAKTILFIMVLGVLAALGLAQLLINSIIRHFNTLINKMDAFSQNELTIEKSDYNYELRGDEIGRLHQRFDRMARRIRSLVDINYKNELLRKEAQIKALESQINPHFLYNTLDAINWRAKASGDMDISRMTESLGLLLRSTLSNDRSLVSLAYEMDLVEAYITIQKIRFEDRLDFTASVDEDLKKVLLPPLTIQPLIENAIRYSMEECTETCHITVQVIRIEDQIIIRVSNSGSSFEENLLEKLQNRSRASIGFGIGLLNINQRIRLLFGGASGLVLKNDGDWAIAEIFIPYQTEEENHHAENNYCR